MVRAPRMLALCALVVLATGCAQQRIRDSADAELRAGNYEAAVGALESGSQRYPESATLRSGLVQARTEAVTRLMSEAGRALSQAQFEQADTLLQRAKTLAPNDRRIDDLLANVATERRQRAARTEAEKLVAAKRPQEALRVIADALKDNPRNSELLQLQRRFEIDLRQAAVTANRQGLSESRPISLDFRDAGLRQVLDVVTRNSGVNFVLDKDVRSDTRVTVFLRSARVEDAIDLIASTHQLARKTLDSNTILIYPNTPEKQREHQEQVVRVFYLASAEAKGAASFLRSMLKIRDPYVDERTNMLALRDSPENIALAERLIALYDTGEPEVLLDVEVIELRTSRLTELGVQFPTTFSLTPIAPAGAANITLGNIRSITRDDIVVGLPGGSINLRRETGDFNILANPRIRARNKEQAKILIGDKVPVITATTGTGGFVSDSVSYVDVGLKLDVQPTVFADDEVAIKIALEVSSLAREIKTSSGSLAYQIGTRNASTLLRLRDGETQLLAGLINNEDRTSASRIPLIGDLPVLGRLFSNTRDDTQRTELVLAITPRILRNVRRPDANETELWVGTETSPRLRQVGGRVLAEPAEEAAPGQRPSSPSPAGPAPMGGMAPIGIGSLPLSSAAPAATPKPRLDWVAPKEVKLGESFVVTVTLDSAASLRGLPLQIQLPKGAFAIEEIVEGDLFRQGGAATSFTQTIDTDKAIVRAGSVRNQATGALGKGSVLTLRLRATAAGRHSISVLSAQPLGADTLAPPIDRPANLLIEVKS
ncbi:hypothetical protein IP84_07015 [beta proteobacterium AAP99]|nr:hypothetical protein IP84_07015 [beta proteobacterium AAP99]